MRKCYGWSAEWSSHLSEKRAFSRNIPSLLWIFLLVWVSACGFTPLYGQKNGEYHATLSSVTIPSLPGRQGQILKIALDDHFRSSSAASYQLNPTLSITSVPVLINRDGTVSRYRIDIVSPFTLTEMATGKTILKDTMKRSASYHVSDSDYSTYTAMQHTQEQLLKEISHDYAQRIGAYLFSRDRNIDQ